ncbi:MAG: CsgG/HfaB family protein [Phycisphaerales bacterium]|jgi:hypothetical protein
MRTVVCILVLSFLLIGGCAAPSDSFSRAGYNFSRIDKIAIVAVEGALQSEAAQNQIADFFALEFLKKGYAPIERAQVQALLEEQQFQASDLTNEVGAAQAGKILNAPAVLIINIPNFGEEISISAKLIDVEDGSILWLGNGSGKTGKTLGTILGAAIGAGIGAGASSEEDELFGGIVGGVVGGVAGYALSPQEADEARKIIKQMCRRIPSRLTTEW